MGEALPTMMRPARIRIPEAWAVRYVGPNANEVVDFINKWAKDWTASTASTPGEDNSIIWVFRSDLTGEDVYVRTGDWVVISGKQIACLTGQQMRALANMT